VHAPLTVVVSSSDPTCIVALTLAVNPVGSSIPSRLTPAIASQDRPAEWRGR
jgi:hypothetical protein